MVLARHWSRVGRQAFRACDCRQLFRNDLIVQTLVVIAESDYPIYPFFKSKNLHPSHQRSRMSAKPFEDRTLARPFGRNREWIATVSFNYAIYGSIFIWEIFYA